MTLWNEVAASALVGVERKPWHPTAGHGDALSRSLSLLPDEGPTLLLKAAALVSAHQLAGTVPVSVTRDLPEPGVTDERQRCGPRSAHYLRSILQGNHSMLLLPECLSLIIDARQRVPEELVPAVMRTPLRSHRDLVVAATGAVGEWLAKQNPTWREHWTPAADDVDWSLATTKERFAILEHLRRTNPAAAVDLIQSTWSSDKAEQRRDFLAILSTGLSAIDEPLLEQALDDRSALVRRTARDLLASLPGCALLGRIEAAVRPRLKLTTKGMLLNRKRTIEVEPFTGLSPELVRAGIDTKGAPQGTGEKAWWMRQAIALLPPSPWSEWLGLNADGLIRAALEGDDGPLLTAAWTDAAIRHSDSEWAQALLTSEAAPEPLRPRLFGLLSGRNREQFLLMAPQNLARYLPLCNHPWSLQFTKNIVPAISHLYSSQTRELARFASLDCFVDTPPDASSNVVEFFAIVQFRREMRTAIRNHD